MQQRQPGLAAPSQNVQTVNVPASGGSTVISGAPSGSLLQVNMPLTANSVWPGVPVEVR